MLTIDDTFRHRTKPEHPTRTFVVTELYENNLGEPIAAVRCALGGEFAVVRLADVDESTIVVGAGVAAKALLARHHELAVERDRALETGDDAAAGRAQREMDGLGLDLSRV